MVIIYSTRARAHCTGNAIDRPYAQAHNTYNRRTLPQQVNITPPPIWQPSSAFFHLASGPWRSFLPVVHPQAFRLDTSAALLLLTIFTTTRRQARPSSTPRRRQAKQTTAQTALLHLASFRPGALALPSSSCPLTSIIITIAIHHSGWRSSTCWLQIPSLPPLHSSPTGLAVWPGRAFTCLLHLHSASDRSDHSQPYHSLGRIIIRLWPSPIIIVHSLAWLRLHLDQGSFALSLFTSFVHLPAFRPAFFRPGLQPSAWFGIVRLIAAFHYSFIHFISLQPVLPDRAWIACLASPVVHLLGSPRAFTHLGSLQRPCVSGFWPWILLAFRLYSNALPTFGLLCLQLSCRSCQPLPSSSSSSLLLLLILDARPFLPVISNSLHLQQIIDFLLPCILSALLALRLLSRFSMILQPCALAHSCIACADVAFANLYARRVRHAPTNMQTYMHATSTPTTPLSTDNWSCCRRWDGLRVATQTQRSNKSI